MRNLNGSRSVDEFDFFGQRCDFVRNQNHSDCPFFHPNCTSPKRNQRPKRINTIGVQRVISVVYVCVCVVVVVANRWHIIIFTNCVLVCALVYCVYSPSLPFLISEYQSIRLYACILYNYEQRQFRAYIRCM